MRLWHKFYYPIKLHYSQTSRSDWSNAFAVLLPYKITLLSNRMVNVEDNKKVLLPYKITLLSNRY